MTSPESSNEKAKNITGAGPESSSSLDPEQFAALEHHVNYGAPSTPPTERVLKDDFGAARAGPLLKPKTAAWDKFVPASEVQKILNGFMPRDMDDKWFVYTDGPDEHGRSIIHFYRSWTMYKLLEVTMMLPLDDEGQTVNQDARLTEIARTDDRDVYNDEMSEQEAVEMALGVFKWCMHVKLE